MSGILCQSIMAVNILVTNLYSSNLYMEARKIFFDWMRSFTYRYTFISVKCSVNTCAISGWRKPKSDHEEDSPSDSGILDRRESKSETAFHRGGLKGKMSFKTASQATLTFLSARKRIEGGLKTLGKKMSKHDVFKGEKQ